MSRDFGDYVQLSLSMRLPCRLGRKIPTELGISEVSGSVDTSNQDALNQVNIEELPLYKFEVLANATDHFSEVNKLGTGGFGPVYKVASHACCSYHLIFYYARSYMRY